MKIHFDLIEINDGWKEKKEGKNINKMIFFQEFVAKKTQIET